jgi:hypothetical protein
MKSEKQLGEDYREMARDEEHEREATEWCDALIGDSSETAEDWFGKLDQLNSEPFPTGHPQPPTPKREVFE